MALRICLLAMLLAWPLSKAWSDDPRFSVDVMALLSKAGCNAGTCHGNLNGKGGFKLSLRGEDPAFDYRALVTASRGRRVNFLQPEQSLILMKATGSVPHQGGVRFPVDSPQFDLLVEWLTRGATGPSPSAPTVERLRVTPESVIVTEPESSLQVKVIAEFSDGTERDVTGVACYELSNLKATVDADGQVTRQQFGETTLVVRYLQQQVPVSIAFTAARPQFVWTDPPVHNFVDRHVFAKLESLRINPSELCSDAVFVRRAFLDAIGRLPTAEEARTFVDDTSEDKRTQLIDSLLARTEFSDFWALKWADVLRTEEKVLDVKGVEVFHGWIRDTIARGVPHDAFVRQLVTGTGNTFEEPAANYYRANRDPATRGETTARLFLGRRLGCAKCHNHPFDRWTQDDYYGWSSLFSQLKYEDVGEAKRKDKLDKNEIPGEQIVLIAKQDEVKNPTTGQMAPPKLLGDRVVTPGEEEDRLSQLARWLTSADNAMFARSQVNFVWYHLMGVGLVDPIDDFRLTNPPSNPALLKELATHFVDSGFDLRDLIRTIMASRTYQLSSEPNATNQHDETSYSRAYVRRLPAEVLLDMQSDFLDTPAEFVGYDSGIRAVQIPGVQRKRLRDERPALGDRFLKTFGKPERIMACDCERSNETTLKQVFVLLGEGLNERIDSSSTRLARLAASDASAEAMVDQLYWSALSRAPNAAERQTAVDLIESGDRHQALKDIAWALMNAKEFLFRR